MLLTSSLQGSHTMNAETRHKTCKKSEAVCFWTEYSLLFCYRTTSCRHCALTWILHTVQQRYPGKIIRTRVWAPSKGEILGVPGQYTAWTVMCFQSCPPHIWWTIQSPTARPPFSNQYMACTDLKWWNNEPCMAVHGALPNQPPNHVHLYIAHLYAMRKKGYVQLSLGIGTWMCYADLAAITTTPHYASYVPNKQFKFDTYCFKHAGKGNQSISPSKSLVACSQFCISNDSNTYFQWDPTSTLCTAARVLVHQGCGE